jgi:hypothetical protein
MELTATNALIDFTTFLGESYDVLQAGSLAGSTWVIIATNLPGNGGVIQCSDTNNASPSNRFYRVRISP